MWSTMIWEGEQSSLALCLWYLLHEIPFKSTLYMPLCSFMLPSSRTSVQPTSTLINSCYNCLYMSCAFLLENLDREALVTLGTRRTV